MVFNPLVIPFLIGTTFFFITILWKFVHWVMNLDVAQKKSIQKNILTTKTLSAIGEVFRESLIHRKIYKRNSMLGYMHMSLAFGWFLMIVVGKVESSFYYRTFFDFPWLGIFFKYFARVPHHFLMIIPFTFIMDLLLLMTLGGVFLAFFKRMRSRAMGMKRTTKHVPLDRVALTALWWIFPLRLVAESDTAAITGNGSFLTGTVGQLMSGLPVHQLELPLWWAYSVCLFVFFMALPFSRYMHIPTEVLLIFLRKWGAETGEERNGYTEIQLNSCSRCGICIDVCQLNFATDIQNVQSVYFVRDARYHTLNQEVTDNCLLCNRCVEACPVGLDLTLMRQQLRKKTIEPANQPYYEYIQPEQKKFSDGIVYFAGCMTHLSPSIITSMKTIFEHAGEKYWFMDEDKGVCCGRPLRQQGFFEQADELVAKNTRLIAESGAKMLVTSCPICLKSFKSEYKLDIPVMHHTEYMAGLLENKRLEIDKTDLKMVYHDPCELGRGCGIYEAPRKVLQQVGEVMKISAEKEDALCCGGSLADTAIEQNQKTKIRNQALQVLTEPHPDMLVTACPLCKKTFNAGNREKVSDVAEMVASALKKPNKNSKFATS